MEARRREALDAVEAGGGRPSTREADGGWPSTSKTIGSKVQREALDAETEAVEGGPQHGSRKQAEGGPRTLSLEAVGGIRSTSKQDDVSFAVMEVGRRRLVEYSINAIKRERAS